MYMNQLHHPYMQTIPTPYTGQMYQYMAQQQQPNIYHHTYMYSQEHSQPKRY